MAEINKKDTKQQIEINRKTIDELLTTSANRVLRMNVLNRMRHELSDEAQILFQYPDYMPAAKKQLTTIKFATFMNYWQRIQISKAVYIAFPMRT